MRRSGLIGFILIHPGHKFQSELLKCIKTDGCLLSVQRFIYHAFFPIEMFYLNKNNNFIEHWDDIILMG